MVASSDGARGQRSQHHGSRAGASQGPTTVIHVEAIK